MTADDPTCPYCKVAMEEGFVLDRGHANSRDIAKWVEGEPERGFWVGLKVKGRAMRPIESFRCTRCGLLQNYARAKPDPR